MKIPQFYVKSDLDTTQQIFETPNNTFNFLKHICNWHPEACPLNLNELSKIN